MEFKHFMDLTNKEKVGFHKDLPMKLYHMVPGLGSGGMRAFAKSPRFYKDAYLVKPEPKKVNEGAIIHLRTLEPGLYFTLVEKALADGRTKIGKAQREAAFKTGKIVISPALWDTCEIIATQLEQPEFAGIAALLRNGDQEVSGFALEPTFGDLLKMRADSLPGDDRIIDLKTVSPGMSSHAIQRLIYGQGWDIQAGWYCMVYKLITGRNAKFIHVFVEDGPPYDMYQKEMSSAWIEKAQELIYPQLARYHECLESNVWPGYDKSLGLSTPPGWALGEEEVE